MQTPSQSGFYPAPAHSIYPTARAYVSDLHRIVRNEVAQRYSVNLPNYVAGQASFTLPGFANLQLSFPTSQSTAASLFRRIDRTIGFRNQFRQFLNQFTVPGNPPILDPTSLPVQAPSMAGAFESATISIVLYAWQGDHETTLNATVTATLDEMQTLLGSDDGIANVQNLWTDNWENQANLQLGSTGFIERMFFTGVISVDYSNRSLTYNVTSAMNTLNQNLRSQRHGPQTRARTRAARISARPLTRSRARTMGVRVRLGHGRRDDSALYEVDDPLYGTLYGIRSDSQNSSHHTRFRSADAPVITHPLLSPMNLEDYQRHRFDATENYQSEYLRTMNK